MGLSVSEKREIIMNFGAPPSGDDLLTIARATLEILPEEIIELIDEGLVIDIDDMPDSVVMSDTGVESAYDLLALYKSKSELAPGIEKKEAEGEDTLILYRRPILDFWCETQDQLSGVLRQVMIEEIGAYFDFSDDDIEEMVERHYQGLL